MRIATLLGISSAVHAGAFAAYGYLYPPELVQLSAGTALTVQLHQPLPIDLTGLSVEPVAIESEPTELVSMDNVSIDPESISGRQPEGLPARPKQAALVPEEELPAVRVVTTRSEQAEVRKNLTTIVVVKADAPLASEPEAFQSRPPTNSLPGLRAVVPVVVLPVTAEGSLNSSPAATALLEVQQLTVSTFQPSQLGAALDAVPVLASLTTELPVIGSERLPSVPAGSSNPDPLAQSSPDQSLSYQNSSGHGLSGDHPSQNPTASASLEQQAGQQLLRALNRYFRYPLKARRKGWQGEVVLRVQLSERGVVREVLLSQSSGYKALDRAALKSMNQVQAIQQLALNGELSVEVPVSYRLLN
ncbi:MAG: energy transducer TonB [Motiliproteus sp.]